MAKSGEISRRVANKREINASVKKADEGLQDCKLR